MTYYKEGSNVPFFKDQHPNMTISKESKDLILKIKHGKESYEKIIMRLYYKDLLHKYKENGQTLKISINDGSHLFGTVTIISEGNFVLKNEVTNYIINYKDIQKLKEVEIKA